MTSLRQLLAGLLLAVPAAAGGPADGRATAAAEAGLRLGGAELVELEGFTAPDGSIPCAGRSFSNSWHYKFHSGGEWLIVNACGENFINAARHNPYRNADEPRKKLPYAFAAPGEVLKKMEKDGVFKAQPNPLSRDVLMRVRMLPAAEGRPEGCYWFVSQGKAKALADCAGEKTWALGVQAKRKFKAADAAAPRLKPKKAKSRLTAGRFAAGALALARAKSPGAYLLNVEAIVAPDGTLDCAANIPWEFTFGLPEINNFGRTGADCGARLTKLSMGEFDRGKDFAGLAKTPEQFRDSDEAASVVPEKCPHKRVVMKLRNYKPGKSPVPGHSFLWELHCGSQHHYIDAVKGLYLGKE
ncbi:MAG: hypothetical protein AB7V08_01005 [Elusimicrobiales bacterium]